MNLRKPFRRLQAQVDALSLRERALLLAGTFMILFLLWDWLLMSDLARQSATVNTEIRQIQDRMNQLSSTLTTAAQTRGSDPNATLQDELGRLRTDIETLDVTLGQRHGSIIPPQQMAQVLESVLAKHGKLKLIGVRSLDRRTLFEDSMAAAEASLPGSVFRHGMELEVEGRYLDVLAYLQELENLPAHFFWDRIVLDSRTYPANRVRILVYSLNLEEGWLGV